MTGSRPPPRCPRSRRARRGLVVLVVGLALVATGAGPGRAAGTPWAPEPVGAWPLVPRPVVVAAFDPPGSAWGAGHRGVDLLGAPGQAVRAALPGRVTFAGRLAGRGVVVVDHGSTRTTYEPVGADVDVGATVASGARIGVLQLSGSHCFPRACLHWGWLRGTTYLDPLLLVGAGPVRLLPLWRDEPVGSVGPVPPPSARVGAPTLPYAGWRPLLDRHPAPAAQARGCACW